jgi:hypothetical protein
MESTMMTISVCSNKTAIFIVMISPKKHKKTTCETMYNQNADEKAVLLSTAFFHAHIPARRKRT